MGAPNVLLVEDDTRLSELISSVLALAGYRPIVVSEHAGIGEAIENSRPECVIMDGELNTSGQNRSWADAAAIRRGHPEIPIVMMTADSAALAEARAGRSRRRRIRRVRQQAVRGPSVPCDARGRGRRGGISADR